MDVILLSTVCAVALLVAVMAVTRWGGLEPTPRPLIGPDGTPPPAAATVKARLRSLSIAFLAGGTAGALTAGLGGRLMMRIMAATSSERVQGLQSDADETIGEITFGGSLAFVLFIGVTSGLLGGALYLGLRRWLPRHSARRAGLVLGLLALGLAPLTDAINRDNRDFFLLDPDPLALALIVGIFLLGGMTVASVVERADRSWPHLDGRPGVVTVLVYAPLLVFIPLWFVLLVFVVVVGLTLAIQHTGLRRLWIGAGVDRVGRVLVTVAVVGAVALTGSHALDILTAEDILARAP